MSIEVQVMRSFDAIDEDEYRRLFESSEAPYFYHPGFLRAAERSPLLPVHAVYYLLARDNGRLVGFLPAYLQSVDAVDPLGLLARTAKIEGGQGQRGLFSHVMHCFDSQVVCAPGTSALHEMIAALRELASAVGAQHVGLLNVADPQALDADGQLVIRHLVDRYRLDLTHVRNFDALLQNLGRDGRQELNRQLRKFDAGGDRVSLIEPPFDERLEELARLCQRTTAKNGTPQYFPAVALARFTRICGDPVRLILVESEGSIAGGFVCFLHRRTFYVWSAGMRYDITAYSPYAISFAHAYRWAFAHGIEIIEAGRLNERIKARLGLKPLPLYSATRAIPAAAHRLPDIGTPRGASHGTAAFQQQTR